MELNKKEEAQIWDTLMAHRRRLGPDPDDHPSVKRRMEYDFVSILLIVKWTLTKLSICPDGSYQVTSSRRFNFSYILLSLILVLLCATTTLSWLSYQTARSAYQIDQEASAVDLRRDDYLRAAYLGKAIFLHKNKISITPSPEAFEITFSEEITGEPFPVKITVPHQIPPEEYERLLPQK